MIENVVTPDLAKVWFGTMTWQFQIICAFL